jgi:chromosomal replication initiation ATPase DnaA
MPDPEKTAEAQLVIDIFSELRARNLTWLLQEVCEKRGVMSFEVCGNSRTRSVSRARHELWWLIRHESGRNYSLLEIARLFRRDHSTIRHGISAHQLRSRP